MAEPRHDPNAPRSGDTTEPPRYEETNEPQNPPNSLLQPEVRRGVVWSYFVPLVVLFAIIGVATVYWSSRSPRTEGTERVEVGTVGSTQGGFDPGSQSGSTREEIESRSGDLTPITSLGDLRDANAQTMRGRQVVLTDVVVDAAGSGMFWLRDGDARIAVIPPAGAPAVQTGARVDVDGHLEPADDGSPRVRGDRVSVE